MVDRSRAAPLQKSFNWLFRGIFKLRKGRVGFRGAPSLMLHTVGRRSGKPRITPLLYLDVGDGSGALAVVASNGGDDRSPAWMLNLLDRPDAEIDMAGGRQPVRAHVATAGQRAELWPRLVAMYASYDSYQAKTDREIPVILLTPTDGAAPR